MPNSTVRSSTLLMNQFAQELRPANATTSLIPIKCSSITTSDQSTKVLAMRNQTH
ncbi:unnamed protein product [Oikopleura dioica]|uniref:Uncharacterized protein n=1 Tax=Oikopleura dioica TaxID=34765 RepID=E4X0M2_OIKDI|nr:unnamed protein product [Oikopleura dioica]